MTSEQVRVVLVDDHTLFRKGLAELLDRREGISVAGVAGQPDEALDLVCDERPDLVLMDLNIPPCGGLELLRRMRAGGCQMPMLVLTVSDDQDDLVGALRAGARGYLLKDMEPDDLVDAIHRAVRGETVVAPAMTSKLVELLQKGEPEPEPDAMEALTPREREVLAKLAQGASNKAIARDLEISTDTVKLHVRHILAKLNLSSRVEAAVFAARHKGPAAAPARRL